MKKRRSVCTQFQGLDEPEPCIGAPTREEGPCELDPPTFFDPERGDHEGNLSPHSTLPDHVPTCLGCFGSQALPFLETLESLAQQRQAVVQRAAPGWPQLVLSCFFFSLDSLGSLGSLSPPTCDQPTDRPATDRVLNFEFRPWPSFASRIARPPLVAKFS